MQFFITALVNAAVGLLIGWSGIAGFLLPIYYVGYLQLPVTAALTLSFAAFAVSGAIGAFNYHKQGNLPIKAAIPLSIGSLAGAIPGVALNALFPAAVVKILLYIVVLASGISILVRNRSNATPGTAASTQKNQMQSPAVAVALGFFTAVICALSGAGGPILVMPLLVALGVDIRSAIGIALLDSVFIALPSIVGYGMQSDMSALWGLLATACIAHGLGVIIGSKTCNIIKQKPLKTGVALFSIAIAIYMIGSMWL